MSNSAKYWDNNVSIKTKKAVQEALGVELIRQTELDEKLAVVGRDERKAEAKRKCAERRLNREERKSANTINQHQI